MAEAFYEQDGGSYVPTELTRGPWDPGAQHAGPPAALLGREIERLGDGAIGGPGGPSAQLGRITYEVLRPVRIAPISVAAQLLRPGRRVELIEAIASDEDGPVIRATAWRLRSAEIEFDAPVSPPADPIPGPEDGSPGVFAHTAEEVGYHSAMDYRFVAGVFMDPGPATVWMRMRHPLVAGEEPTPLQRVLIAADSGNGVSAALDWRRFLFINVDLTVHLHRMPLGEWICLDAVTAPERNGIGLSDTALHDQSGPLGRALQTLLIAERPAQSLSDPQ